MPAPDILPLTLCRLTSLLGAADGGGPVASPTAGDWLDSIISVLGLGITLLVGLWWLLYDRRDPLRIAPHRPNRLGLDSVLIAAGVYVISASILLYAVGPKTSGNPVPPTDAATAAPSPEAPAADKPRPPTAGPMLADSLAKIISVGVCLVLVRRDVQGGLVRFFLGRRGRAGAAFSAVVLLIVSLPLCYLTLESTLLILRQLQPDFVPREHTTIQLLRQTARSPYEVAGLYLGAALVAPFAEEVFFRGILQTVLVTVFRSRWRAILITAAAFAALHQELHALPALFLLGLILGYAYERTGGLLAPLLVHAMFNGKTLIWDALWP